MRKMLLAATALSALSVPAFAADLPSRSMAPAAPVAYAPAFTWTGFYVGVNAGYGWTQDSNITTTLGDVFSSNDDGGFTGGAQIGYNMQFGQFVAGLETDIQYADFGGRNFYSSGFGPFPTFATDHGNYFGTVRGRLGYAFDRALIYVTGGLAYGDLGQSFGSGDTNAGWTVGGGIEYAFTNNWTAKLEGLYVNLDRGGRSVALVNGAGAVVGTATLSRNTEFGVFRAGLNYKF